MTRATQPPSERNTEQVEDLRAAVAARDEFIAVAAHELRNPMTPIAAQVDLLLKVARRDGATPQLVAGLERLGLAVERFIRRATAILEIGRLNAGQLVLEPSAFDLTELLRDAVTASSVIAARSQAPLRLAAQENVSGVWDRLAVEQVIDNLLSNAVKYGAGAPIDVTLANHDDMATLSVRDHGPGIAPEDRARIFERFEQAVGQRQHGGFGIGLWLARQLVEAMGGSLEVESRLGEGSTFVVRLPLDITKARDGR